MSADNPDKKDLTRIEDLSEFLHDDDPEIDRLLENESSDFSDEDTEVSEMNSFPYASPTSDEEGQEATDENAVSDLEDLPDLPESEDLSNFEENADESSEEEVSFLDDDNPFSESNEEEEEETSFESDDNPFAESEETSFDNDVDTSFDTLEPEEEAPSESEDLFESPGFETSEEIEDETDEQEGEAETEIEEEEEITSGEEQFAGPTYEAPPAPYQPPVRENFDDIKKFANSLSYGDVSSPGNPPFSLILKDIKYKEDAADILSILREHGLVNESSEKDFQTGLDHGALLIGQLSEYSAIYLAHRLRRFDLDISIGLSDDIHPSKSYEREGRGLTTKDQLYQNKKSQARFDVSALNPNDIIVATTSTLEGYKIERYIDVITEHMLISETELREAIKEQNVDLEETLESEDYHVALSDIYRSLMQELKPRAFKLGGNAVLGITFSLAQITGSDDLKITCAGNVAWVNNA